MSTQTTMAGQDPKDKGRARTDINEARKEALDAAKQKSTFKWNPVHVRKRNVVAEGKHGLHWVCKLCGQTKAGDKSKFVAHILGPTTVGGTKHYYRNQRMDETWCYAYQDVKLLCDDLNEIKDNDSEFWTASGQKLVFSRYLSTGGGLVEAVG